MTNKQRFRILNVDLTTRQLISENLDEIILQKFIGGSGLAAKILWDETTAQTDPFSSENVLIFMTGPLTGTIIPSSTRHIVAGISPLTEIYGEARSGGKWSYELRHAGFDGLVIRGRSETPVYLWLNDRKSELRDASHIWGKDTYDTHEFLKIETDDKASTACIGPAGERQVRFAGIVNDGKMGRIAARCGLGALMGSKKLKAVVARGTLPIEYYDEKMLRGEVRNIFEAYPRDKEEELDFQVNMLKKEMDVGNTIVKNCREGTFEGAYALSERLRKTKFMQCKGCPFPCMESHWTKYGERNMVWEHWVPLGTNCMIDNGDALQEAYSLCQRYGMDSISIGGVMAFAMECYEKGLITRGDTGGIELDWGNDSAMLDMIKRIGEREGIGHLLGEGVRRAAEHIGGSAHEFAMHVKGLELPAMDPRASMSLAVQEATENIGAGHMRAHAAQNIENVLESKESFLILPELGYPNQLNRFAIEGKGKLTAIMHNLGCVIDSLVVCCFLIYYNGVQPGQLNRLLTSITGWELSLNDLMLCGERIYNLMRMVNVRRGIGKKDDTLPQRILTQTRGSGGAAHSIPLLEPMLKEYYTVRGWNEKGLPTDEKLRALDLKECLGKN